jgi:hypothetical protein
MSARRASVYSSRTLGTMISRRSDRSHSTRQRGRPVTQGGPREVILGSRECLRYRSLDSQPSSAWPGVFINNRQSRLPRPWKRHPRHNHRPWCQRPRNPQQVHRPRRPDPIPGSLRRRPRLKRPRVLQAPNQSRTWAQLPQPNPARQAPSHPRPTLRPKRPDLSPRPTLANPQSLRPVGRQYQYRRRSI